MTLGWQQRARNRTRDMAVAVSTGIYRVGKDKLWTTRPAEPPAERIAVTWAEVSRLFCTDFSGIWPLLKYSRHTHREKEHNAEHACCVLVQTLSLLRVPAQLRRKRLSVPCVYPCSVSSVLMESWWIKWTAVANGMASHLFILEEDKNVNFFHKYLLLIFTICVF